MIAKWTNEKPIPCPRQGRDGRGGLHTNLPLYYEHHPEKAAEDGYYPMTYTDKPEGNYRDTWQLLNGRIVQIWTEFTPEPEPEDPILTRLDLVEAFLLEISGTESVLNRNAQAVLAELWAQKIRLGQKTYAQTPMLLKEQVRQALQKAGAGPVSE